MDPALAQAISAISGAISMAIMAAVAYYFPRGSSRFDEAKDKDFADEERDRDRRGKDRDDRQEGRDDRSAKRARRRARDERDEEDPDE